VYTAQNARQEYGRAYRAEASKLQPATPPLRIEAKHEPPDAGRQELVILGNAGQRIITAGELVCLAGATAGLHATQKNDYPITVMRGHSVSELILSKEEIGYTGIDKPSNIIALGQEGVNRRKKIFAGLTPETLLLKADGVDLPATLAEIREIDFKAHKVKTQDWALAALAVLAKQNRVLTMGMLKAALKLRFKKSVYEMALSVTEKVAAA
jgi:Pyruvate/2-oxoacid:ferredoxin oxidoreductase gamma subunit